MFSNLTLRIDVASIPDFRRVELAKGALALTELVKKLEAMTVSK